jgi:hypothetical protein
MRMRTAFLFLILGMILISGVLQTTIVKVTGDDTNPPTIMNSYLQPKDGSTIDDNTPAIVAAYNDPSGIDAESVILKVDGFNVTSSADVNSNAVTYTPRNPLDAGLHVVYLEVKDVEGNQLKFSWLFEVASPNENNGSEITSEELFRWSTLALVLFVIFLLYILIKAGGGKRKDSEAEDNEEKGFQWDYSDEENDEAVEGSDNNEIDD